MKNLFFLLFLLCTVGLAAQNPPDLNSGKQRQGRAMGKTDVVLTLEIREVDGKETYTIIPPLNLKKFGLSEGQMAEVQKLKGLKVKALNNGMMVLFNEGWRLETDFGMHTSNGYVQRMIFKKSFRTVPKIGDFDQAPKGGKKEGR